MPYKRMANDVHLVLRAEGNVLIGVGEIELALYRLYRFPFQNILRGDRVEVRRDDASPALVASRELIAIQRGTDPKVFGERVLERPLA